jgi:uncharacterized protein (DUF362 family)
VIDEPKSTVVLRSTRSRSVRDVVAEAMERCGWEELVPRDSLVVLKPNLCTAVPDKAASSNTDPAIAEAVCEVLLTRTKRVIMGESDGLRQKAQEAFAASGYVEIGRRLGVELVNFSESAWRPVRCEPAGDVELPALLLDADVFITLPVLKTHALTYFTGAIKNQWGCLPQYNRILLHKHLDPLLATLHRVFNPRLAVMDGIIAMEGRGPANGKPRRLDVILASSDSVALDATAMRLIGLDPARSTHVVLTAQAGLGRSEPEEIEVDGDWARHACRFEPAILDKAIAAMNYMSRYRWFVKYMLEKDYIFYPVRAGVQVESYRQSSAEQTRKAPRSKRTS